MRTRPGPAPLWVELSGENLPLADRELVACVEWFEPAAPPPIPVAGYGPYREVHLSSAQVGAALARRIAYAHQVVRPLAEGSLDLLAEAIGMQGALGGTGRVRVAPGAPGTLGRDLPPVLGRAFVHAGGRVDLKHPERDFLAIIPGRELADPPGDTEGTLAEVVAEVPRSEVETHRSKHRTFRKPITLPPRLARSLVNLAGAPPGGLVLDPFCGTGAILIEAGTLGYRTVGADLDGDMVRGSLLNLREAGLTPERILQSSIAELPGHLSDLGPFDAVVCDPPYGRSATTGGEGSVEVLRATIASLAKLLRPGARAVLLLSTSELRVPLPSGIVLEDQVVGQRVHRSLTRYIVVLRREGPGA